METDSAGNFLASSFGWATARDWARLVPSFNLAVYKPRPLAVNNVALLNPLRSVYGLFVALLRYTSFALPAFGTPRRCLVREWCQKHVRPTDLQNW